MRFPKIFITIGQICLMIYFTSCKPSISTKSRSEPTKANVSKRTAVNAERLVGFADKYLGAKYKMAGTTPSGFDCSGFSQYVFKEFGIDLPRTSDQQANIGKEIKTSQAQMGDLIFFRGSDKSKPNVGHVGIVVSEPGERIKFIHSSSSRGVIYDYLDVKYFADRFVSIKRVW
jgi:cell wall-associated NlpC family hydrolase